MIIIKPIHYINYHPENRPYIDKQIKVNIQNNWSMEFYDFKTNSWSRYIFLELEVNSKAKQILDDAQESWHKKKNNFDNYKGIIFLESSSSKLKDQQLFLLNIRIKTGVI